MTTKEERINIYTKVYAFMLAHNFYTLPTPIELLCLGMRIKLVPLSKIIRNTGLTSNQVFRQWGNTNGHLVSRHVHGNVYDFTIAYNDSPAHKYRKNFTLAEELSHIILGHFLDGMYDVDNPKPWCDSKYRLHDKHARIAAGLLICPPPVFIHEMPSLFSVENIQSFCDISKKCAEMRYDIMKKYWMEMMSPKNYTWLRHRFRKLRYRIRCPKCGLFGVELKTGVCLSCQPLGDTETIAKWRLLSHKN